MECHYTLTEAEVVKAMQLHGRGANSTLMGLTLGAISLVLLGVFTEYEAMGFGGAIGGVIGYFTLLLLVIPFNAKKQYQQNRALRSEIIMCLSKYEIEFKGGTGESKLKWSDIHKWRQSKDIYLLYITSNMFHIIPSRVLGNNAEFNKLLVKQIGPRAA